MKPVRNQDQTQDNWTMLYMYTYELVSIGWLVGCGLT